MFEPKYPLAANHILRWRRWNQDPGVLPLESSKFIIHCRTPLRILCSNPIRWWFYSNVINLRRRTWFPGLRALLSKSDGSRFTHIRSWFGGAGGRWYNSSLGNESFRLVNPILGPSDHRMSIDSNMNLWISRGNGRRYRDRGRIW